MCVYEVNPFGLVSNEESMNTDERQRFRSNKGRERTKNVQNIHFRMWEVSGPDTRHSENMDILNIESIYSLRRAVITKRG